MIRATAGVVVAGLLRVAPLRADFLEFDALRIGVEDRYESETPAGVENNDVDYRASLVYSF